MYNVAVCDDDIHCAKTICKILESEFISQDFNCEIICVTTNQDEIYTLIKEHKIDILFLDIDFRNDGKNGIDFANELRDLDNNFYLIFLSAHIKYMPLSFASKTFDFLVKPIHKSVITLLVERLKKDVIKDKIRFLNVSRELKLNINTITYIEKVRNKCYIHTSGSVISVNKTLDGMLSILPSNFFKCHRSIVLNSARVSICNNKKNLIIFDNGETCPASSHFSVR